MPTSALRPVSSFATWPFLAALLVLGLAARPGHADSAPDDLLFPIERNGLVGFVDSEGRQIVVPRFDAVDGGRHRGSAFFEGMAAVRVDRSWGFVDRAGYLVVEPRFARVGPFSEGLAAALVPPTGGEPWSRRWGYADLDGRVVIDPAFDRAEPFSSGLAYVEISGKGGFVDRLGRRVVEPGSAPWSVATSFSEGRAAFLQDDAWGLLDTDLRVVTPPIFADPPSFSDGFAAVRWREPPSQEEPYGFVDRQGRIAFGRGFDLAWPFSEGLARVRSGGVEHVIDTSGAVRFSLGPEVDWMEPFSGGLAAVRIEDQRGAWRYGYMDRDGEMVIEPTFVRAASFVDGLAFVETCGDSGYIDTAGRPVWGLESIGSPAAADPGPPPDVAILAGPADLQADAAVEPPLARILGIRGPVELEVVSGDGSCTPLGRPLWTLQLEAGALPGVVLAVQLLEQGTFLTRERLERIEAALPVADGIVASAGYLSRFELADGRRGYTFPLVMHPDGAVFATTVPGPRDAYELLVQFVVDGEKSSESPAEPSPGSFHRALQEEPMDAFESAARVIEALVFPR